MSFGSTAVPQPDKNIGKAAMKQAQLGEQWLSFSKDAFAVSQERQKEIDEITKAVSTLQLNTATEQADWARKDRQRYEDTYRPIEDEFVAEAKDYASPEKQAAAASEARADVQKAAAMERGATERRAAAYGINPASGRFAGIDRAGELGTAVASAGASNRARQGIRDKGLALKGDLVNLGRGLPVQAAQAAGLGVNAGSAAVGSTATGNGQYLGSLDIMNRGFAGGISGYAGQAATLSDLYKNQLDAWQAQQDANGSLWEGIGGLVGIGLSFPSSKKTKRDRKSIGLGGGLDALKKMPVEKWRYKEGIDNGDEHIGPMAEDFKMATGAGDGQSIPVQDAIGVTMKAVQDLDEKVEALSSKVVGISGKPRKARASAMKEAA